jgi:alpha-L-arabinofuranosidase
MNNKLIKAIGLFAALSAPAFAGNNNVTNEPDSVYLFSYSATNGKGGLKFAWSADGKRWMSVADGYAYVSSDFGPWGNMKLMIDPHLTQRRDDNSWQCVWQLSDSGQSYAVVTSPDLLYWHCQKYVDAKDVDKNTVTDVYPTERSEIMIDGEKRRGWTQRVAFAAVERLQHYAEHKLYRQSLYAEQAEQDGVRFANLKPLKADIRANVTDKKGISPMLIGIFFEDINYAADGGLYAELVQNRDFEYSPDDAPRDKFTSTYAWELLRNGSKEEIKIETTEPLHDNNPHYATIHVATGDKVSLRNNGFDGITVKRGERYNLSLYGRVSNGDKGGKVVVKLINNSGEEIASTIITISSKSWSCKTATLTAMADATEAMLCVEPLSASTYNFDMISLFPQNTFHGRKNGLRADLAQTLADLHPRFVRFPGGCVAHGDGIDNMYNWKGSIGTLAERQPIRNLWGYHQTRGLGYYEYFSFCEDIGAEPLPVVAAGVPCQNSGSHTHYADNAPDGTNVELLRNGQQGGIPLDEMDKYIQDILDLIEYANGDSKSYWGAKRAAAGHKKPFNLKYIGIGNEDLISEVFEERFKLIYKAVSEKHPEITIVGTVGPFNEGTDYTEGWRLATELNVPIVDEHYYVSPGWMIHNQDFYDRYDRSKSKVYLGEYAAHLPGRPSNVETALAEALYLTSIERNGDIVTMSSYAPLLAKDGHTQWRPDLIYFNNNEVRPTVDYYTQLMYGENSGTDYISSTVSLSDKTSGVKERVGASVVKDEHSGDYIVKLVNMLPVDVESDIVIDGIELGSMTATKTLLTGAPDDKEARPVTTDMILSDNDKLLYNMPKYSFTVIRLKKRP